MPDVPNEIVDVETSKPQGSTVGFVTFISLHTGETLQFKPIIVTNYADDITVSTTSERVFGRMDPIKTFEGNERQIQMTFLTPQRDGAAAVSEFNKLKTLMAAQYPTYRAKPNVLLSPPLFRVIFSPLGTTANPMLDEIGFLNGMGFNYLNSSEIINTPQLKGQTAAPRYYQVNFTFNVQHRQLTTRNISFPFA